jgi:outer membrane protein OmpA-like peptidoglycan-associated protein
LVDETYELEAEKSIAYKGFVLRWYDGALTMNRTQVAEDLRQGLGEVAIAVQPPPPGTLASDPAAPHRGSPDEGQGKTEAPGTDSRLSEDDPSPGSGGHTDIGITASTRVAVDDTPEGVRLRLSDIRFVADQAIVLPEERPRLEAVARALRVIEDRTFLVIGHTALAGTEEGRRTLSVERARAVVDFLVGGGIEPDRFIYEGRGAAEPIGDNATSEGRALNRRVEIVILED